MNDKLLYRATAKAATIDRRSGDILASMVTILGRTSTASANKVSGNFNRDTLEFEGDVRVRDHLDRLIKTKSATFYSRDNRMVSTSTVILEGDNFTSVGRSIDADFKARKIQIKGPFRAKFSDK